MRRVPRTSSSRGRLQRIGGLLLLALLFRAYVPVGFMPAAGAPFRVELCPAGLEMPAGRALPAEMVMPAGMAMDAGSPGHHHAHHAAHAHFAQCPFGSAPAAAPLAQWPEAAAIASSSPGTVLPADVLPPPARFAYAHPPRGPPRSV